MSDKIPVDIDGLKYLAMSALRNDKVDEFIPVALQWAEGATSEIEQMRSEVRSVLEQLDHLAELWGDEGVFRTCRDRLRKLVTP
jgi:hypothetical protein